ncbi:hypothetical protein RBSWK_02599 [Rhodopirellula baltica SWK14]|uniref:Uncharacterized protein n=1 Tax=Rhodopirellula baltica SWK14 TaxID=993516 RepID=L7CHK6_RHOBT|nr:hypothetical protein RBSWK_02599 [Rhodopirellula baltica SWK14]
MDASLSVPGDGNRSPTDILHLLQIEIWIINQNLWMVRRWSNAFRS